jgi:hypothetical protein
MSGIIRVEPSGSAATEFVNITKHVEYQWWEEETGAL